MTIDEGTVDAFVSTLDGLDLLEAPHARFYYYDPVRDVPHDRRLPFATIVSADDYEKASNLDRPGVFRVNMGVERETYRALFGREPKWTKDGSPVQTGHDFSQLDVLLPHPVYAPLAWICILSPSERSWPRVQELLREAHAVARRAYDRRRAAAPRDSQG